jgi:hypothetical protein
MSRARPSLRNNNALLAWMVTLIPLGFAGGLFLWVLAGSVCETDACHNPAGVEFGVWAVGVACWLAALLLPLHRLLLGLATAALLVPVIHLLVVLAS